MDYRTANIGTNEIHGGLADRQDAKTLNLHKGVKSRCPLLDPKFLVLSCLHDQIGDD